MTRRPRIGEQILQLSWRSTIRNLRQPAQFVPAAVFPLFLLAVNSAGFDAATKIPGFPTDSYLTFALAVPFMQSALFGFLNAGTDIARDIESGFLNRLALTPISRAALVAGELAGVVALGTVFGVMFLVVGLAAGANFEAGPAGVPVLFLLIIAITAGFGCLGIAAGARSGSSEAVQGLFPALFALFFFSSMAMPRDLIEHEWFKMVATANPVSYMIEGLRSLFIDGFDGAALWPAFALSGAMIAIFTVLAARNVNSRLVSR
jgi:ABC-2 type transport system permease protein